MSSNAIQILGTILLLQDAIRDAKKMEKNNEVIFTLAEQVNLRLAGEALRAARSKLTANLQPHLVNLMLIADVIRIQKNYIYFYVSVTAECLALIKAIDEMLASKNVKEE